MRIAMLIVLFILLVSLLSCSTRRVQKMSSKGASLTEEKIVMLSQDCDFVFKMIGRGLKDVSDETDIYTTFMSNDFLVALLKVTPCLYGKTKDQVTKLFGNPIKNCDGCPQFPFRYYFHLEDDLFFKYYIIWFRFEENRLEHITVSQGTRVESAPQHIIRREK